MLRMNKKFMELMRENCPHVAGEKFAIGTIFKEEDNVKVEAQKFEFCILLLRFLKVEDQDYCPPGECRRTKPKLSTAVA
jgi:hypothetical protein